MTTLQLQGRWAFSNSHSLGAQRKNNIHANINIQKLRPNIKATLKSCMPKTRRPLSKDAGKQKASDVGDDEDASIYPLVFAKLEAILEEVGDRVEVHKNVGEQRDSWNHLLLSSINAITLSAATIAGLGNDAPSLRLASTAMFLAAAVMLAVMNTIQPSQLAEEQRVAARLFKQLHGRLHNKTMLLGPRTPTATDVDEAIEAVLALDRAYPLPLLGGKMLDKFPAAVEPAVWWTQHPHNNKSGSLHDQAEAGSSLPITYQSKENEIVNVNINGWSKELEEEMEAILGVLKRKDYAAYIELVTTALKVNKVLAISGPLLTAVAAVGSAFGAGVMGAFAGAMASIVNTVEHGGQVGMVVEMYRSAAGSFRMLEDYIESNLKEADARKRENGGVLEMKVALQLGRSVSELRHLAASVSSSSEEYASLLF